MGKDYYKILSVDKNADEDELKRAYKKAALKSHPDRNKNSPEASKKFQEVSPFIHSYLLPTSDI